MSPEEKRKQRKQASTLSAKFDRLIDSLGRVGKCANAARPSRSINEPMRNCAQEELFKEIEEASHLAVSYLVEKEINS